MCLARDPRDPDILAAALFAACSLNPSLTRRRQCSPTLAEAVKETDAKYRYAAAIAGDDSAPKIEAGGDEAETASAIQEIAQGPIKAVLSYVEETGEEAGVMRKPVVTVFADGKEVAKFNGESVGFADPPVGVQIAELDGGNPYPEVVVSFYTGGAHCCSTTSVVTASPDGSKWTTVDLGQFDGGPLLATDLNRDGRYEFMIRDNVFLYAFACYACSEAPLKLLAIDNGTVKDVTREARFAPGACGLAQDHDRERPGGGERREWIPRGLCGREDPSRRGKTRLGPDARPLRPGVGLGARNLQ